MTARRFVLIELMPGKVRRRVIAWTISPGPVPDARGTPLDLPDDEHASIERILDGVASRHAQARATAAAARAARIEALTAKQYVDELHALHVAGKLIERIEGKEPYYNAREGRRRK